MPIEIDEHNGYAGQIRGEFHADAAAVRGRTTPLKTVLSESESYQNPTRRHLSNNPTECRETKIYDVTDQIRTDVISDAIIYVKLTLCVRVFSFVFIAFYLYYPR